MSAAESSLFSAPSPDRISRAGTVLVVDDDPHGLTFFRASLKMSGLNVFAAENAVEAQAQLEDRGLDFFDAVLSDFRMPGRTGLDLLRWIRERDRSLATVIITAQGEKELVKAALAGGAVDFLEKPVTHQELREVIGKAIADTARMRKFEHDQEGLRDAGRLDRFFNTLVGESLSPHIRLVYQPLHEVGGDFFSARKLDDNRFIIIAGDVSGHDIRSGFISAYFQGMIRGFEAAGQSPWEAFGVFNQLLCDEWSGPENEKDGSTSLSVCALEIDLARSCLNITSSGFPPLVLCDRHGFVTHSRIGAFPMGWDHDFRPVREVRALDELTFICVHTDGLIDFATNLGIDPLSLAHRLMMDGQNNAVSALQSPDDLLLIRFFINPKQKVSALFQPILHESYSGDEYEDIDHLQAVWRRSIQFAVGDELGDRLYDLLICLREGMLNAFHHGCEGSPEKVCTLQMSYVPDDKVIRVRIDDPGKGHKFDLKKRLAELDLAEEGEGRNLGLGIIQHLSDKFGIENKGSSLLFDFHVNP